MFLRTGLYKRMYTYFVNGHSWFVNPNEPIRPQLEEKLIADRIYIERLTERLNALENHLKKVDVNKYNPKKKLEKK